MRHTSTVPGSSVGDSGGSVQIDVSSDDILQILSKDCSKGKLIQRSRGLCYLATVSLIIPPTNSSSA